MHFANLRSIFFGHHQIGTPPAPISFFPSDFVANGSDNLCSDCNSYNGRPATHRQHQEDDENHLTESPAVPTHGAIQGISLLGMTNSTVKAMINVFTPTRVMPNELNPRET